VRLWTERPWFWWSVLWLVLAVAAGWLAHTRLALPDKWSVGCGLATASLLVGLMLPARRRRSWARSDDRRYRRLVRVWISTDGRWRLEQRDSGPKPWRVELHGGLIAEGRTRDEAFVGLARWLVDNGAEMPEFGER
jgi:hypothetical protein